MKTTLIASDYREFKEAILDDGVLQEAINWIQANLSPEDVFSDNALEDWAEENGWVKDET